MLKDGDSKKSPTGINIDSFTEHFKAIINPESRFFQADDDIINFNQYIVDGEMKIMFSELDLPFTKEEVLHGISELNLGRSAGPDYIINEFLVYGKDVLADHVLKLFNNILEHGYFPDSWSEGFKVPIHKKGSSGRR